MRYETKALWIALCTALGASAPAAVAGAGCEARAAGERVALVELFTSEGCSSCPPADRWVADLPRAGFGPQSVVALAYHVDYWDQIGWRDRFGQPAFSARQREIAQRSGTGWVYTPQILFNGADFRPSGEHHALARALERVRTTPARVAIELHRTPTAASPPAFDAHLRVLLGLDPRSVRAYVALFENGLSTDVRAGENRGAKLQHDYVVREFVGPLEFDRNGVLDWTWGGRLAADVNLAHTGLAAFVSDQASGEVLQAAAIQACNG